MNKLNLHGNYVTVRLFKVRIKFPISYFITYFINLFHIKF